MSTEDGGRRALVRAEEAPSEEESSSSDEDSASAEQAPVRSPSTIEAANRARGSFKRPETWMIAFGALLAICAGIVNVVCVLHLGTVVSHMTGMATKIGLHLEGVRMKNNTDYEMKIYNWNSTLTELLVHEHLDKFMEQIWLVFSFAFGAFLTGLVVPKNALRFGGDSFYGVALVGNSVLLFTAWFIARGVKTSHRTTDDHDEYLYAWAACCAACAAGLQNAMCTLHLGAVVRTTHVTGTVTDIGSTTGRATAILVKRLIRGYPLTYLERVELGVDWSKLKVLNTMFFAFLFGCFLGASLYKHFVLNAFLFPASATMICGIVYMCFSGMMKKQIANMQAEKIEEDVKEIDDALVRVRSFMKSREAQSTDQLSQLDDQVSHALEVIHGLEAELHVLYEGESADGSPSGHGVDSRASRRKSRAITR